MRLTKAHIEAIEGELIDQQKAELKEFAAMEKEAEAEYRADWLKGRDADTKIKTALSLRKRLEEVERELQEVSVYLSRYNTEGFEIRTTDYSPQSSPKCRYIRDKTQKIRDKYASLIRKVTLCTTLEEAKAVAGIE
jgi:hypothetical protein